MRRSRTNGVVRVQLRAYDSSGRVRSERIEAFGRQEALLLDFWPFNGDNRIAFGERQEIVLSLPELPGTVEAVVRYHDWIGIKRTLLTLREKF